MHMIERSGVTAVDLLHRYTVRQMLKVSGWQLDRMVETGIIREVTLYGNTRRYAAADVYSRSNRTGSSSRR